MKSECGGFTIIEAMISMTVLVLLTAFVLGSISNTYMATTMADNAMLVTTQESRALGIIREDLLQTSRNFPPSGNYGPFLDPDPWQPGISELRFRKINGFSAGHATYENQYTCYYLDTTNNILWRRYRDLSGTLLTDPPAEVIGLYVTTFTPVIDANAKTVTITLTNSKGRADRNEDASITRTVVITPYNID